MHKEEFRNRLMEKQTPPVMEAFKQEEATYADM